MAEPAELQRVAAAMNAIRPDWPAKSCHTVLARDHAGRAFQDLVVAACAVAADPRSATPARLAEHGPWWVAAYQASRAPTPQVGPGKEPRCDAAGHEHELARACRCCRAEQLEGGTA